MTVVALTSAKHAPGVTTLALALTSAWADTGPALLVEADPAGGDVAARVGLPLEPGLVSLAAAARRPTVLLDLDAHSQALPAGGEAVLAPSSPEQAVTALGSVADRLAAALGTAARPVVVDCGRWLKGSPSRPLLTRADWVLVVMRPTVEDVEHIRVRRSALEADVGSRLAVILLGERPYGAADVEATLGVPVLGAVPLDRRGADAVVGRSRPGTARRSALVRSARSFLDRIRDVQPNEVALS
jgi:hypothetical protein